jgi:hypothetical protein
LFSQWLSARRVAAAQQCAAVTRRFSVDGVPVCDEAILVAYFERNTFPLLSTFGRAGATHLAWFKLYDDFAVLQSNFQAYLLNPPQISEDASLFELMETRLPAMSENSLKISYKRLVPKNIPLQDRLNRNYTFPLHMVDDINEQLAEIAVVI